MFSRAQESLGTSRGSHGSNQEALQDRRQIEPAIEPILDFSKIPMRILSEIEGMVGTRVGGLELAEEGIHCAELLQLDAVSYTTSPRPRDS